MSYGFLPEGLRVPTYDELLEKYFSFLDGKFGYPVDRATEGGFGQLAEISCLFYLENWEYLEKLYQNFRDPAGEYLNIKAGYVGITRKPAIPAQCTVMLSGVAGTFVPIGTGFRRSGGNTFALTATVELNIGLSAQCTFDIPSVVNGVSFKALLNGTPLIDYTGTGADTQQTIFNKISAEVLASFPFVKVLPVAGGNYGQITLQSTTIGITFAPVVTSGLSVSSFWVYGETLCVVGGVNEVPAGFMTEIVNPVSGLTGVTNPLPAQRGKDEESDFDLALRHRNSSRVTGGGSTPAIRAKMLEAVAGVSWCQVFENTTLSTDANGLPPKSIALVIEGGDPLTIAQNLNVFRTAGIATFGTSGYQVADASGQNTLVSFSRPVPKYAWIKITILEKNFEEVFPVDGVSRIIGDIYQFCTAEFLIGDDFVLQKLATPVFRTRGVKRIKIETAITDTPMETPVFAETDISISPFNYLTFSKTDGRIIVTE